MDREDYGFVHAYQPFIPSCYDVPVNQIWGINGFTYKAVGGKLYRFVEEDGGEWVQVKDG